MHAIRRTGLMAVFAALLGVAGDLVLQYTSNPAHLMSRQSLYLLDVSPARLLLGHYVGVAAILMEIAGFWSVYRALQPAGERYARSFFLVNAFGAMLGAAFHATFVFVGLTLQTQSRVGGAADAEFIDLLASFNSARVGLAVPALAAIVVGSLLFALVTLLRPTLYPRWMAVCNPLGFLLLIIGLTLVLPASALVLAPTAINLSHLLFFSAATLAVRSA
ncbi:MAG TPA: DUF6796 family protein [Vicinamibacterales bacterium]|nr:DUF6796 family protein [Vicinamibacterales bacterium]